MEIKNMLEAISKTGLSDYQVAAQLTERGHTIKPSIINRLRTGVHKSTSFERGKCINNFYEEVCGIADNNK